MIFVRFFIGFTLSLISVASLAAPMEINGLYVNTFGSPKDPAVVYIHGGPGYNSYSFEASAARKLADRGFYVVVYDQRGSGRSADAKSRYDFTYKSYVRDLKSIVDSLKIKKPVLLGHSFGGSLALSYLEAYPREVSKVVLIGAPISMPETFRAVVARSMQLNLQPTWNLIEYQKKMAALAQTAQVNEGMFGYFPAYGIHPNGKRYVPPNLIGTAFSLALSNGTYEVEHPSNEQKKIAEELKERPDKKWANDMKWQPMFGFAINENYATFDFFNLLQKYRDRVFGIYGSEDHLFNEKQLGEIKATLPKDHFVMVSKASHAVFEHQRTILLNRFESFASPNSVHSCSGLFGK